jgi:hypothetical protein
MVNEESSLLTHSPPAGTDGGGDESSNEANEVPLAEEPSTAKLILVLGSIWLGCFLAALGVYSHELALCPLTKSICRYHRDRHSQRANIELI